jgi:WD40 repeat protein
MYRVAIVLLLVLPVPALAGPPARVDLHGDPLPEGALARMGWVRLRHRAEVLCLAFAPDGKALATSGHDGGVFVWDAASGKQRGKIAVPGQVVCSLVFSPDGKRLAGGTMAPEVRVWEVATGAEVLRVKGRGSSLTWVGFSPDGGALMAADDAGRLWLWGPATGKELRRFTDSRRAAFSSDGKLLALAAADGTVRLLDAATGKVRARLAAGEAPNPVRWATFLAFSPDGRALACAGLHGPRDGSFQVWDVDRGARLRSHSLEGYSPLALARDGRTLALAGGDGLRLWDLAAGKELRPVKLAENSIRFVGDLSPDGKVVASARGPKVRLWDVATGRELLPAPGHEFAIHRVAFSPDGRTVASAGADETLRVWQADTGKELVRFPARGAPGTRSLAYSPDGKLLGAVGDRKAWLWDLKSGKVVGELDAGGSYFTSLAFAPDGRTLATTGPDGAALWDMAPGKAVRRMDVGRAGASAVLFSRDGKQLLLVSARDQAPVRAYDAATGKELPRPGQSLPDEPIALSAGGRLQSRVNSAVVRDAAVRTAEPGTLLGLRWQPGERGLAISSDGRLAASGHDRGAALSVWELATGKEVLTLRGEDRDEPFSPLAFAPDGTRLVTASREGTLLVWRLTPGGAGRADDEPEWLWKELAGDDAAAAYRAGWALSEPRQKAVDFFRRRLRPARKPDPEAPVRKLIADLDSAEFAVREAASKQLQAFRPEADALLRNTLAGTASLEVRRRIERMLNVPAPPPKPPVPPGIVVGEALRTVRAIQVLERIGTPEAREVLRTLAGGFPEARETQEAKGSLVRLATSLGKN